MSVKGLFNKNESNKTEFNTKNGLKYMKNLTTGLTNWEDDKISENKKNNITKNIDINIDKFCDLKKYPSPIPTNINIEAAKNIGIIIL